MSAVADKLREARALIERGWTQGRDAIDADGEGADPRGDEAACWCINGALFRANYRGAIDPYELDTALEKAIGLSGESVMSLLIDWNDAKGRTQAEVIAAFDRAIQLAEADNA